MVKIRLKRMGTRNAPCYRIVVADARSPRDGKFIENIGFYDPCHSTEKINTERFDYWMSVGAQTSQTVKDIVRRIKNGIPTSSNKEKIRKQKKQEKISEESKVKTQAGESTKAETQAKNEGEDNSKTPPQDKKN